jgi:hypothetical protein
MDAAVAHPNAFTAGQRQQIAHHLALQMPALEQHRTRAHRE